MTNKPKWHDDPNTQMTIVVGAIGVFIVFLIIVGLQAFFYHTQKSQTREKSYGYAFDKLRNAQSQQEQQLHAYRWINQAQGVVAIPIEQAMQLTIRDLQEAAATQPLAFEVTR